MKWWVVCSDHTMGPYRDEATAEKRIGRIDPARCGLPHSVVAADRAPEPAWQRTWDDGWAEDHE